LLTADVVAADTLHGGRTYCVRRWVGALRLLSGTGEVIAQDEIARLLLSIEAQLISTGNGGGHIGKSGLPADSSGQKIPGLHLSVAYSFRSERAIGT
jgi:hypothetical protein